MYLRWVAVLAKSQRRVLDYSSFILDFSTSSSFTAVAGKCVRYPPLIIIAPGAIPVAWCGVLRYDISRSLTASLMGLFVPMAIFTVFPRGFMKHSASFPWGWYGGVCFTLYCSQNILRLQKKKKRRNNLFQNFCERLSEKQKHFWRALGWVLHYNINLGNVVGSYNPL